MKIYIELLVFIIIPMIVFIFGYLWVGWSKKRLLKKYDPEKDLSKLGEDKRLAEIEIHNGNKTQKTVGRERSRGFGRGTILKSSRDRTTKANRARPHSDQDGIVQSRGSELSSDNPIPSIEPDNVSDSRGNKKIKRYLRRRLGRRRN